MKHGTMVLSDFFPPTEGGSMKGRCIACGRMTEEGKEIDFSNNFTGWSYFQAGDCLCPRCYTLCRDQMYRKKSWVASKDDGVKILAGKDECREVVIAPPHPPFMVYLTYSLQSLAFKGQKQGFLQVLTRVNTSKERFFVCLPEDVVLIEPHTFLEYLKRIDFYRNECEIKKHELFSGEINPSRFKSGKITPEDVFFIKKVRKTPQWRLAVGLS